MRERIKRAGRTAGLHLRRQAIGYVALAVALTGSAYAGQKGGSGKVGARDLRPVIVREGQTITVPPGQSWGASRRPASRVSAPSRRTSWAASLRTAATLRSAASGSRASR
jgi:hypothetical protein